MSSGKSVSETVFAAIRECCEPGVTADLDSSTPMRQLRMDSLKMVQIVYELECSLGIEISEHLLFQLETVGDLVALAAESRGTTA